MKLLLINPHDSTYTHQKSAFKRRLNYAALTLPTLASLVPRDMDIEIQIVDEGVDYLDRFNADLVGITSITASAFRAYEIADMARNQGIPVVLGGVHPTLLPDEAAGHADAVVIGLAEQVWPRLLRDFTNGRMKNFYEGSENIDLSGLPLPRRDLLNKKKYLDITTVQASRGCVNNCKFCCIPETWGRKFHQRPVEDVINEIKVLGDKRYIFLDPSPIEDRAYALNLFKQLIPLKIKWAGLSTIKVAFDRELLDLVVKSGCLGLLIGFETLNQNALDGVNKAFSLTSQYREAVRILHESGLSVLGCFVFGFDEDDESVFEKTIRFIDEARIDLVRYAVYTPFPGTEAFKELDSQYRILTRDWSLYNTENVVFVPKKMSPERLQEGLMQTWNRTYSMGSIARRFRLNSPMMLFKFAANMGFRFYYKQVLESK